MKTPSTISGFRVAALSLLAAVSFIFAPTARAAVTVSNLTNAIILYDEVKNIVSTGQGQTLANDFTTGSSVMSLDGIRVNFAGGFDPSGVGFKVSLFSDTGPLPPNGGPQGWLADLTGPSPVAGGLYSYTPVNPYILAANTRYWAVFSALHPSINDEMFPITTTLDPSETGDPGWSIGDHTAMLALTNGIPNTGVWTYSAAGSGLMLEVSASSVPEPSRTLLLGTGLAALIACRRRPCRKA